MALTTAQRAALETAAATLAFLALAWLAFSDGGLEHPELGAVVPLLAGLLLYVATRGWRLPWWLHLAALALPLSLTAVALLHADPVGGLRITRYAAFALLLLGSIAAGRTPARRRRLAGGLGAVGILLFLVGIAGLLASGDPGRYLDGGMWTNTFGAAMAMTGALGLGMAILGRGDEPGEATTSDLVITAVGWVAAVTGIAGTIMSSSRICLALLGLAAAVLLALAMRARGWRGGVRWLTAIVAGTLLAVLLRLPALLPAILAGPQAVTATLGSASGGSSPNPVAALVKPDAGGSWTERLDLWALAAEMGWDHPLIGVGLSRFGSDLQVCYGRQGGASDPHSELLRAWADGGLVALLPMLAAFLGAAVLIIAALRLTWAKDARPRLNADPARWAAIAGLGVAAAHLAVDFDWAYPLMIGLAAVLAAIAAGALIRVPESGPAGRTWQPIGRVLVVAAVVVVALVAVSLDPAAGSPLAFTSFPPGTLHCP